MKRAEVAAVGSRADVTTSARTTNTRLTAVMKRHHVRAVRRFHTSAYAILDVANKERRWIAASRRIHPIELTRCATCGVEIETRSQAAHDAARCPRRRVLGQRSL